MQGTARCAIARSAREVNFDQGQQAWCDVPPLSRGQGECVAWDAQTDGCMDGAGLARWLWSRPSGRLSCRGEQQCICGGPSLPEGACTATTAQPVLSLCHPGMAITQLMQDAQHSTQYAEGFNTNLCDSATAGSMRMHHIIHAWQSMTGVADVWQCCRSHHSISRRCTASRALPAGSACMYLYGDAAILQRAQHACPRHQHLHSLEGVD